jgi:DNA-binding MarR family transcriptional regulator
VAWPRERPRPDANTTGNVQATPPTATELAEALFQTTHALKYGGKQLCDQSEPFARAISMPQARLLGELWELWEVSAGNLRMSDVSAALGVTPRNVTTIVDGLERRGLVQRRRDQHDRRAIFLELTEQGRAHVARIRELHQAIGERFFAPLDANERCALLRLLSKVRAGLSAPSSDLV